MLAAKPENPSASPTFPLVRSIFGSAIRTSGILTISVLDLRVVAGCTSASSPRKVDEIVDGVGQVACVVELKMVPMIDAGDVDRSADVGDFEIGSAGERA